MNTSLQTQAVLLLTAWFSKPTPTDPKPLTPKEWGRFAQWLKEKGAAPELLLSSADPRQVLAGWSDQTISAERIVALLARSAAMGLALEKWQRAGLWVMTRSDADYPTRLKRLLKFDAPPLLFGSGNRALLDKGGIAVVGSRDASEADLAYASGIGHASALEGDSVISGGARGVDEAAMLGGLKAEGTVIGVLSDSLLRAATSAKYRQGLMRKNLILISPFYPEAGFDVGNAMARNKYIYCLADAAIVVATSKEKGGTWNGAIENLKVGWVPLWVKRDPDPHSGNSALAERGGRWLPEGTLDLKALAVRGVKADSEPIPATLFEIYAARTDMQQPVAARASGAGYVVESSNQIAAETSGGTTSDLERLSFHAFFLRKLETEFHTGSFTPESIQEKLDINKSQLNEWLKRAVDEGAVIKLTKPVRYQLGSTRQVGLDL